MIIPKILRTMFAQRERFAHKYTVGTVGIVGGSRRFPHAPIISALGARAAGAGLVSLSVPDESRFAAAVHVPEAIFAEDGSAPKGDVLAIGPGLGLDEESRRRATDALTGGAERFVIDADALTLLANGAIPRPKSAEVVLTPHEGEAARLLAVTREEIRRDRRGAAREMASKFGAHVVLKGPGTLVVSSDGSRLYENMTGNPQMALGGMGDLLCGVIAARWSAAKADTFASVASAVWLHSSASDELVAKKGDPSLVSTAAKIGELRVLLESFCA